MVLVVLLLFSAPVSAAWYDSLVKGLTKKTEKQIIKQEERTVVKQSDNIIAKQNQIRKNNYYGDLLETRFKNQWCKTRTCVTSHYGITKNLKNNGDFYIINDYMSNPS